MARRAASCIARRASRLQVHKDGRLVKRGVSHYGPAE